jgi:dienelactone hydrolase
MAGHPVRVWFPSLDGSPQHAEILKGCGRYPLVVLAHGSCPPDVDHYRLWAELPAVLARSGYVVVVPELQLGAPSGNESERRLIGQLAAWARSGWEHAETVMPAPATALVGHSWGAGLLGHVATHAPASYAAYVSLSGVEVPAGVLRSSMPTLSTWGDDLGLEVLGVQISQWEALTPPAHVAVFHQAGHWDYLPPGRSSCEEQNGQPKRGTCTLTPLLAADIVACFLTRHLRPEGVPFIKWGPIQLFVIPRSLRPPAFYPGYLTTEQKFFAGGHLQAWNAVPSRDDCGVTLRWVSGDGTGELVHD